MITGRPDAELEGVLLRMEGDLREGATPEEKKRFGKPLPDTMGRSETMRGQRVKNKALREKITYATDAAELIKNGYKVGMSGFTGSGYPKLVPQALAEHILREHSKGGKLSLIHI